MAWSWLSTAAPQRSEVSVERAADPDLAQLIGELAVASADFARLWSRHDVRAAVSGRKKFNHAQAGTFELEPEVLTLPGDRQTLCVYHAKPGSTGAEALVLLNTAVASGWATPNEPSDQPISRLHAISCPSESQAGIATRCRSAVPPGRSACAGSNAPSGGRAAMPEFADRTLVRAGIRASAPAARPPLRPGRSMIAEHSRGSLKVFDQPENASLEAIATEFFSSRSVKTWNNSSAPRLSSSI